MKMLIRIIVFLVLILMPLNSMAQFDPDNVCRVENGRIIFALDLRWNEKQKKEVATLFELDSTLLKKVYQGQKDIFSGGLNWKVKTISSAKVELSVPMDQKGNVHSTSETKNQGKVIKKNKTYVLMMEDTWMKDEIVREKASVPYGSNNFSSISIFQYKDGTARFFLPGYKSAGKVNLAGTFNNWDTKKTPMVFHDSGWIVTLKLLPGKYFYKYIVDERWMEDPFNNQKENDGYGNINSFIFCYNHVFALKGRGNAKKVVVTGSFNNWNRNELKMTKTADGWILPIYLKEGTYTYKFIADNEWLTDPLNGRTLDDGKGNTNSVLGIGEPYLFRLPEFSSAKKVFLTGTFNNWNPGGLQMNKINGGWQLPYVLSAGMYEYKFIVDGKWIIDSANPYTSGSGDKVNSVVAIQSNYTFTLNQFLTAKKVVVAGNFNNWNPDGYRMLKKDGKWIFPAYLKPGKTIYKFVVDDEWILDPGNKLWEENEYGTGNSLLWIGE
jgi:hypothetical protein